MAGKQQSKGVSIRSSLIRNLVILVMVTAGAILLVTVFSGYRAVENLSERLVQMTAYDTETELERFFDPVTRVLEVTALWGEAGLLDPTETESVNLRFMPFLEQFDQVSSLLLAREDGREHLLLQVDDGFKNRQSRPQEWGPKTKWLVWQDAFTLVSEEQKQIEYDCRTRPWFKGAMEAEGKVHWTEPYTFFTTKDPGITAAVSWKPRNGGLTHVTGFDLLLADVSRFTTALEPSPNGIAVVLTDDGKVVGLPRDERFESEEGIREAVLGQAEDLGVAPLADAMEAWKAIDKSSSGEPFQFTSDGDNWWAAFAEHQLGPDRSFWIAAIVPESDFMGEVARQRNVILLITILAMVIAIAMSLFLARGYGRPLEALSDQSKRIRELDLERSEQIETRLAEINQLATAQEQMLATLKSFSRYVPMEVVRKLVKRGEVARIGGRTADLTILFTDIKGFTTISEQMSPQELTVHMSEYFEGMLEVLNDENATVDKFIGDAIMAFWGAPIPDEQHATRAVTAVLECIDKLDQMNEAWVAKGLPPLYTCFGMASGSVVVGNMGSPSRLSYTVLGDRVNLASRLEGINRQYGTDALACEEVVKATGDTFEWRAVDLVAVKGKTVPVKVFEPLGEKGKVPEPVLETARTYEKAFSLYLEQDFEAALEVLATMDGEDMSVSRLTTSCEQFIEDPPGDGWDGVSRFKTK